MPLGETNYLGQLDPSGVGTVPWDPTLQANPNPPASGDPGTDVLAQGCPVGTTLEFTSSAGFNATPVPDAIADNTGIGRGAYLRCKPLPLALAQPWQLTLPPSLPGWPSLPSLSGIGNVLLLGVLGFVLFETRGWWRKT